LPERRLPTPVALLAALWLALGFWNVARGAAHAGPRYRFWAFQHLCYSDVIALHGDRYLGGGHPLPYLSDRIEYPPLLGVVLWLPSYAPGGPLGHLAVTWLLLSACLAAALWALARLPGAAAWWLGATPALLVYAGLNWDLLPIALVALALLALDRGRAGRAGALAAAGVTAKIFPAALVPPALGMLGARWRDPAGRRATLVFPAALLGTALAVCAPFALLAWDGFTWFFRFNAGRGAENSAWEALHLPRGPALEALSAGPLAAASLLAAWAAFRTARRGGDAMRAVRLGTALALVVWIATNKVWSPQYALYGFLAGALAAAPRPAFLLLTSVSLIDFFLAFAVRALRWDPWFLDTFVNPGHLWRTAAWLSLAAWIGARLLGGEESAGRSDELGGASRAGAGQ
jgi:hypothetical protein